MVVIDEKSVTVQALKDHDNAVLMTWQRQVQTEDVKVAFSQIMDHLKQKQTPLYVVVDILRNPNFPVGTTITAALLGPYRHPDLAAWLVVGSNWMAKSIERALANVTGRKNVLWFDTMEAALRHLADQTPKTERDTDDKFQGRLGDTGADRGADAHCQHGQQ
jgi:hypothetical protein